MSETIADFLLARIAEDEAAARSAAGSTNDRSHVAPDEPFGATWEALDYGMVRGVGEENDLWDCEGSETLCTSVEAAAHIARHDPARVLAECEAKRAILMEHFEFDPCERDPRYTVTHKHGALSGANRPIPCITIRALTYAYSTHPDYQRAWAL